MTCWSWSDSSAADATDSACVAAGYCFASVGSLMLFKQRLY